MNQMAQMARMPRMPPGVQAAGGQLQGDGGMQGRGGMPPPGYGQRQGGLGQKPPGAPPSASTSYRDVKADQPELAAGMPTRADRVKARLATTPTVTQIQTQTPPLTQTHNL